MRFLSLFSCRFPSSWWENHCYTAILQCKHSTDTHVTTTGFQCTLAALPNHFPQHKYPKIIELLSNHNKGYWPGNHWLHSQHGKHWDHWMLWKQDLLLWLQTSKWVPFKGTKVPSFSIRAGLITRPSISPGLLLCSQRVWLCNKLFLIGQLLLISSTNNDEAEKHNTLFVIFGMKTAWTHCVEALAYPF